MKTLAFFLLFLTASCTVTRAQEWFHAFPDTASLLRAGAELGKDFEKEVKAIDQTVAFVVPKVKFDAMGPYYLPQENTVFLPQWQLAPEFFKEFCAELAGGAAEGEKIFGLFFNGFYVPHELGHALQFAANNRADNEYDNEYVANCLGLLYWRKKGKSKELEECYNFCKQALTKIKNPIPPNEDVKAYFTLHYEEFGQDPYKYSYIQLSQFMMAYEDTRQTNFEEYVGNVILKKK
ncbi:hypothetical protein [Arundinibacter roseus]|uniref:Uncharacterized protein n=1 Tax=Arundinibacter roseus TaxID=2070510 RepID=A0A4R4KJ50_9BACT|nr:hypothetical protein [Arundinibacter roseus]TDB66882.1 hypothetical protein EZE20_07080 [Arundinibacter roseus]